MSTPPYITEFYNIFIPTEMRLIALQNVNERTAAAAGARFIGNFNKYEKVLTKIH